MGALTANRKREADFLSSNQKPQSSFSSRFDFNHVSKKSKTSPLMSTTADRRKSFGSRISLYPDIVPEIKREIQAPTRVIQGFTSCFRRNSGNGVARAREEERSADKMGNFLGFHYRSTKNAAIDSLRYFKGEKGQGDVDADGDVRIVEASPPDEVDNVTDGSTGDEGPEEEEQHGSGETHMILEKYKELEAKVADLENPSSSGISDLTDGKMLESLSIDTSVPPHKKLLDSTRSKYDDNLKRLSFEINLQEKRRACQQLLRPAKKEEEGVKEPFLPLTEDDKNLVATAFSNSSRRKTLVSHDNSNIEITGEVLRCLLPRAWLNDEVINLYLELLKERERSEPKKFLKCHFFNTFFYKKRYGKSIVHILTNPNPCSVQLIGGRGGYDYKSVRRWTTQRKLGYSLFECDKIFVPVHKEIHWCLAVINKRDQKFQYLDSLGGMDKQVMGVLAKYFVDEVKDKNGKDIDVTSWKQEYVKDLPNQENGFDCGVFMIKYADFYSRDIGLCFSQEHMPYFRLRTAKEILRLKAD